MGWFYESTPVDPTPVALAETLKTKLDSEQ